MALGTNHGHYVKQDRMIKLRLTAHSLIMQHLADCHSFSRDSASKEALIMVKDLSEKELRNLIKNFT